MRHVASMQEGWRRDFRALLCGKRAEAEMGDGPRDVKRSMGAGIVAVSGLGPAPKIRRPRSNLIDKFEVQGGPSAIINSFGYQQIKGGVEWLISRAFVPSAALVS